VNGKPNGTGDMETRLRYLEGKAVQFEREIQDNYAADREARDAMAKMGRDTHTAISALARLENSQGIEFHEMKKRFDFLEAVVRKALEPRPPLSVRRKKK
jgi:hypothetical protein